MTGPLIVAGLLALVAGVVFLRKKALMADKQPTPLPQEPRSAPTLIYRSNRLTAGQREVADLIVRLSQEAQISAPFMLALAVTESSLNPKIIGDDGVSVGLFQLNTNYIHASQEELLDAGFNTEAALEKMRLLIRSYPGNSYGDYAEAWTLGGAGRFKKNRRNPLKWTTMQKAIDDLSLDLYLTEHP